MKKILSVIVVAILCCGLMAGCGSNDSENVEQENVKSSQNSTVKEEEEKGSNRTEEKVTSGEVYKAIKAVANDMGLEKVELTHIVDYSKGINNLIISIEPPIMELKESLVVYMTATKEIVNNCSPVLLEGGYIYVLYAYAPGVGVGDLRLKTELVDGMWKLCEGELGNVTGELATTPYVLDEYPDIVDDLMYAIGESGIAELQQ